jgi:hypothetical protein
MQLELVLFSAALLSVHGAPSYPKCNEMPVNAVCVNDEVSFYNECYALQTFPSSHPVPGSCQSEPSLTTGCSLQKAFSRPICGEDGNIYLNRCSAFEVGVEYKLCGANSGPIPSRNVIHSENLDENLAVPNQFHSGDGNVKHHYELGSGPVAPGYAPAPELSHKRPSEYAAASEFSLGFGPGPVEKVHSPAVEFSHRTGSSHIDSEYVPAPEFHDRHSGPTALEMNAVFGAGAIAPPPYPQVPSSHEKIKNFQF